MKIALTCLFIFLKQLISLAHILLNFQKHRNRFKQFLTPLFYPLKQRNIRGKLNISQVTMEVSGDPIEG